MLLKPDNKKRQLNWVLPRECTHTLRVTHRNLRGSRRFLVHESLTIMINRTSETDCSRQYSRKEVTTTSELSNIENDRTTENAIFQNLKSSELLKHLLKYTNENKCESNENCEFDTIKNAFENDTCKKAFKDESESLRQFNNKKESNVSSMFVCEQKNSPMPLPVSQNNLINKLSTREERSAFELLEETIKLPQEINNGSMDNYEASPSSNIYREDLQRYLSDESSIEEEFKSISNEFLSHEHMDIILQEAERALRIQSSPSSQESDCELTELLPLTISCNNSHNHTASLLTPTKYPSPTTSQTGSSYSPSAIPTDNVTSAVNASKLETISVDNENNTTNLDDDMVLVPAGK